MDVGALVRVDAFEWGVFAAAVAGVSAIFSGCRACEAAKREFFAVTFAV